MDVEFCNLTFTTANRFRGTKTEILKGISGQFMPGQLCAILGPSGAGKTTLLNAVSGYKTEGVGGELRVNNTIRNDSDFRRRSCYITQEDLLPPLMTVEEAMVMAANLKLPRNTGDKLKKAIVCDILNNLGLQNESSTRTEKLSGGQKKRLSIALELINNPPIFFLDEPTSGLDNVSASQCIKLLKRLSSEGRTIVCTIHQPPDSIFQMFDVVYVVARGLCIYQGTPKDLVPYLSSVGFECPVNYNPADYLIELTDGEAFSTVQILSNKIENGKVYGIQKCIENHSNGNLVILNKENTKKEENQNWIKLKHVPLNTKINYTNSSWYQFWIILQRLLLQVFRNKTAMMIQALHCATCGFALGSVYFHNANDGVQMYNHLKFIVGAVLFYSHTHLMIPVLLFPQEVKLVKKEHFNRWYGLMPYYMATTIAKLPTQILLNTAYTIIIYFMSGLPREFERFLLFVTIGNAVSFASEGMGLAIGATFNVTNGSCVGPTFSAPFIGLAIYGFDFSKKISSFMQLLMKTSPMRCGVVGLVLTCFGFNRPKLDCDDVYCHFDDPKVLLDFLDIHSDSRIYSEVIALVLIILFYRVLAYLSIRKRFST